MGFLLPTYGIYQLKTKENPMKKYLAVLFLIVFIAPSIALASWWNPFSWNIFHKKEVSTPIQTTNIETVKTPEVKIAEQQKQVTAPTITTIQKNKETKKVVPVVDNSAIVKAQVEAILKEKSDEQAKLDQQKTQAEIKQAQALQQIQQSVQQISQNTTPTIPDMCSNIDGIQASVPAGMTGVNYDCVVVPIVTTYTITKNGDVVLSNASIDEVRTFVSNLNNYVTWRKKADTASVSDLTEMLSSNSYILTQKN